jgi:glutamyl-tRNA reductase
MGILTARHLLASGVRTILITNRTFERGVELAREVGGTPVPFEQFSRYVHLADLLVGAAGDGGVLLTRSTMLEVLRARKQSPVVLIDLAVPRSFESEINTLDNVYLYDVDDLQQVAQSNQDERDREALKAERIIDEAVDRFWRWLESRDVVPVIVALREKMEEIRAQEIARAGASLHTLTPEQRAAVDYLTGAIVNKILHDPLTRLRDLAARDVDLRYVEAMRHLFALLDEPDDDET